MPSGPFSQTLSVPFRNAPPCSRSVLFYDRIPCNPIHAINTNPSNYPTTASRSHTLHHAPIPPLAPIHLSAAFDSPARVPAPKGAPSSLPHHCKPTMGRRVTPVAGTANLCASACSPRPLPTCMPPCPSISAAAAGPGSSSVHACLLLSTAQARFLPIHGRSHPLANCMPLPQGCLTRVPTCSMHSLSSSCLSLAQWTALPCGRAAAASCPPSLPLMNEPPPFLSWTPTASGIPLSMNY